MTAHQTGFGLQIMPKTCYDTIKPNHLQTLYQQHIAEVKNKYKIGKGARKRKS